MKRSVVRSVIESISRIIWWVLKRRKRMFGTVWDVTTYKNNHSLCHDCGVCVVMDLALALSDVCKWLHKKQSVQSRVLYLDVHGDEKGRIMAKKNSLRTRLLKEYTRLSKIAVRDPRNWKEVANRMRWEKIRKILWRRYDYMQSL